MKIIGLEGMTHEQLADDLRRGGKFVIYKYCISVIVLTFQRPSDIYFIPAGHSAVRRGLGFTLLSLVAGWWGFPFGPIFTIAALVTNFGGGKNVTPEVLASLT